MGTTGGTGAGVSLGGYTAEVGAGLGVMAEAGTGTGLGGCIAGVGGSIGESHWRGQEPTITGVLAAAADDDGDLLRAGGRVVQMPWEDSWGAVG